MDKLTLTVRERGNLIRMSQYNRMEFNVPREHSFATTSTRSVKSPFIQKKMNDLTRSRCEYLLRNNRLVNDWNTVVEQLLMAHPKVVKRKKKKAKKVVKEKEKEDEKSAQIKILVERIEGK